MTRDRWILRQGSKARGFRYVSEGGTPVRAARELARIAALSVPPAWTDVHVASSARSAVQAWGYDARGRKQYRYHAREVERGTLRKYYRVRQMAHDLPTIRRTVASRMRELERGAITRPAVTAAVVRLIADGFLRVGNERYTQENGSFGVTTLRKKHCRRTKDSVGFSYRGKSGIAQRQLVTDPALARAVERLMETPGPRLFRWRDDDGRWHDLNARDVNGFLRDLCGVPYTAKDFRTWGGTLRAATVLAELDPDGAATDRERRKNVMTTMRLVSAELGNTPAICRTSYVHPMVVARYLDEGETIAPLLPGAPERRKARARSRSRAAGIAARKASAAAARRATTVAAQQAASAPAAHAPEEQALITFLDAHFPERRKSRRGPSEKD